MNIFRKIIILLVSISILAGCSKTSSDINPSLYNSERSIYGKENIYTFIWMSDTQYYSKFYPDTYNSMTEWINHNENKLNIKYVFHTGDVVNDRNDKQQWENASNAMKKLNVPYIISAGNHDVGYKDLDYSTFLRLFRHPSAKGYYKDGQGVYDLATLGKTDYIFMAMGWQPDDDAINWMNNVLETYPARKAILIFHDYMNPDGSLTEQGHIIYNNVVMKNPNVRLVLCGHIYGSVIRSNEIDDNGDGQTDRTVYQILTDYQNEDGGNGFMKILTVDEDAGEILVETFSPVVDINSVSKENLENKGTYVLNISQDTR